MTPSDGATERHWRVELRSDGNWYWTARVGGHRNYGMAASRRSAGAAAKRSLSRLAGRRPVSRATSRDGITRRKRADGTTAYQVRVKREGKRKAETFDTLAEARRYKADAFLKPRLSHTKTCDEYVDHWLTTSEWAESTRQENRYAIRPFQAEFGRLPLDAIDRLSARKFAVGHRRAAVVARALYNQAIEDTYATQNPFANLGLEQSRGRKDEEVMTEDELMDLADTALSVHGPEYGPVFRALILFSGYVGPRKSESFRVEWRHLDLAEGTVEVLRSKRAKKRPTRQRVVIPGPAKDALQLIPRRPEVPYVFHGKRRGGAHGWQLTPSRHQPLWDRVRDVWLASLSDERREVLGGIDWHSLRHRCGYYFYIELDLSEKLAAFQLGHSTPRQIMDTYGHWKQGAMERLQVAVRASEATPLRAADDFGREAM